MNDDEQTGDQRITDKLAKFNLAAAEELAKANGLRIVSRRGVYWVYRDTLPRWTYISQAVDVTKLLAIVKHAAGSRNK